MYEFMIKRCKEDCDSLHTNKSTEYGMRRESEYDYQGHANCITKCDDKYKPLQHYDVKTATKNGWYIYSNLNSHNIVDYYLAHEFMHPNKTIKRESDLITPYFITNTNETDKKANKFDEKLDELPDLDKTYETGRWWFTKKTWKLIYNDKTQLFEWQNQTDKKMTREFLIESPLKIGDNIATESK